MLLSPSSLKHHVAAANRGRYALNSIALLRDGTLSTDGHSLLFVPYPDFDPADAPEIEGVKPKSPAPQVEPFLLALDDAAKVAAMVGRAKRHSPPITQLIQAQIEDDSILCGATDLSNAQTMRVRRMDGVFPEVGVVIPDYTKAATTTVNLDQLLRTLKALRGSTDEDVVTIRVIDDQQAIGLSCKGGVCALSMPIQVAKPEDHVPDQLAKLKQPSADAEGPPPAAPIAPPAAPEEDDEDDATPTAVELEDAQAAYDASPPVPEPAVTATPRKRRRRKAVTSAQAELQEILSGA
jgi:hypothetical protein